MSSYGAHVRKGGDETYPVRRHALPQVFDPLHDAVRRQDVDDAEIVHRVEREVLLVRGAKAAFVLVEEEMLPVAGVLLGQNSIVDAFQVRVRVPVHGPPHDVGLLRCRCRGRGRAPPM